MTSGLGDQAGHGVAREGVHPLVEDGALGLGFLFFAQLVERAQERRELFLHVLAVGVRGGALADQGLGVAEGLQDLRIGDAEQMQIEHEGAGQVFGLGRADDRPRPRPWADTDQS
jgi:hypothetical protein